MSSMTAAVRRRRLLIAAAAATLAVPSAGRAADTVYTFTNGNGDYNWGTPGNWNLTGYPNAATADAVIPTGFNNVHLNVTPTVGNFNLAAGSDLYVNGGQSLTVAGPAFVNNGFFRLNDNGGSPSVLTFSGSTTLSGTGTLQLYNSGGLARLNTSSGVTLTQSAGHTIDGFGNLAVALVNRGTVNADVNGQTLFVDASTVANTNLLTSTNGGNLTLDAGTVVNNAGGTINNNGGTVNLANVTVNGGTLTSTAGSSAIQLNGADTLSAVTVSAGSSLLVQANASVNVSGGTLVNNGAITVNNFGGSPTYLTFTANTALTGTGSIYLNNNGGLTHLNTSSGATLTQGAGHLIHGIGNMTVALVNQGTVNADVNGQAIYFDNSTVTNTNLLTATNGGTLQFDGATTVNNAGGTISNNGGQVALYTTAVNGGTLTTSAGSAPLQAYNGSSFSAVTLSAGSSLVVEPNATVNVSGGSLVNNGAITVNNFGGSPSVLNFTTSTNLSGTGGIYLNNNSDLTTLSTSANAVLTVGPGQLIHGIGDVTATIANNGTVNADVNGQAIFVRSPGGVTNLALLTATNGGTLQFDSGMTVTNAGGQINNSGGTVNLSTVSVVGGTLFTAVGSSPIHAYGTDTLTSVTLPTAGTGLTVQANATVNIGGGTLVNNGQIVVDDFGGSPSRLNFNTTTVLSGTGNIYLNNNSDLTYLSTSAGATLNQSAGHLIHGIGDVTATLYNLGTVNADVNGQAIYVRSPGGVTNVALLTATNNGTLQFDSGVTVANAGGQINVSGGTVNLANATVIGGTLFTANQSAAIQAYGTDTLNAVTLAGPYTGLLVRNAATVNVSGGTLVDNGTIQVDNNGGDNSYLTFTANTALTGTGNILLYDSSDLAHLTTVAGATLTQAAGHLIHGFGDVQAALVNNGTVDADTNGQAINLLTSPAAATAMTNNSLFEATGGGTLNVTGITLTQSAAGTLLANGGTVNVNAAAVTGGTVQSSNGSTVYVNNATFTNLTVAAGSYVLVNPNSTLVAAGTTLTNNGTIQVNTNSGSLSSFNVSASLTLGGTGTLVLYDSSGLARVTTAANVVLTQAATHTISGFGDVDAALVNNGTVNANINGQAINLNTSPNASTGVTNNGLIEATNGGTVNVNGIVLTQSAAGLLQAGGGATVTLNGANVSGGTVATAGPATGSFAYVSSGTASTFAGGLTVTPGSYVQVQPGATLNLAGAAAITDNGTIRVNNNSGNYSNLNASNSITLGGTGTLTLYDSSGLAQITAAAGATLTQGAGHTISGFGDVVAPLVNNGTVRADINGQLLNVLGATTNNGTFYATGGGQLYVPAGKLSNLSATTLTGGTYQSDAGGFLNLPNSFVTNAATVILGGGYNFPAVAPLQTNTGTFTIQANAAFTTAGNLTTSGTLTVGGPAGAGSAVVSSLAVNGTLTQTAGRTEVDGTLTVAGQTTVTGGTLTFGANNVGGGVLTRTLPNGLTLGGTGVVALANAASRANRTLLVLPSLTFGGANVAHPTGELDVGQNDAVVPNGILGAVTLEAASGYAAGPFGGPGITSTAAAADPRRLTAVGVIVNNDGAGNRLYGSGTTLGLFDGYNPASADVLIKYTYFGDTNLDGKVNGLDYARVDAGFLSKGTLTGWYNGDFNYDGKVDASDYTLIDNAFNEQSAVLGNSVTATPALSAAATDEVDAALTPAAVPEPATVGLVAVAAGLTLGRRRRAV